MSSSGHSIAFSIAQDNRLGDHLRAASTALARPIAQVRTSPKEALLDVTEKPAPPGSWMDHADHAVLSRG